MATIRKLKSGNYQVQIRLSGLKPISKTFPTKTLAIKFQREVEGNKKLQQSLGNPIMGNLTLSTILNSYMEQYTGKDPSVVGRLLWWGKQYGSLSLINFDSFKIREALKTIASKRTGSTVNRYKSNLSSVFEFAKEEFGTKDNPTRGIRAKPENPHRERFLSDTEQHKLLTVCKDASWDKLYLLVLMALTTGARRGEMLGLKWSDIDFKNTTAKLTGTKNGSTRLLPLTDAVIEELKLFRSIGNHLVFHSSISMIKPFEIKKSYAWALQQAGINDFRFHDLRHTAASNLAQNGANLLEIAEVLGHSNTTITKRYSHLCIDHKRNLINRVMGRLGHTR